MRQIRYITVQRQPPGLLMQIAGFIVGVMVLGVSLVVGAFMLAALFGFALIVAVVIGIRFWWLRRQMDQAAADEYIETEYQVVGTRDRSDLDP